MITKNCIYCGEGFSDYIYSYRKRKYCSHKCQYNARTINEVLKKCKNCKKGFKTPYWRIKIGKGKFCVPKCSSDFRKGQTSFHTKETKKKISKTLQGRVFTEEHKRKIGKAHKGEKSYWWKGGVSVGKNAIVYKRLINRIRESRKKGAEGSFTIEEWYDLIKKYNYTCLCCKKKEPVIKLTVDHVISVSKGGPNYIDNIQPLCGSCNSRKNTKIIDYR